MSAPSSIAPDVGDSPQGGAVPAQGALVCLDIGLKRIGVAACDGPRIATHPVTTLHRRRVTADIAAIQSLCAERDAVGIVAGLPLNMDGSAGAMAETVRAFVAKLAAAVDIPVVLWDERLSTFEAEERLQNAGLDSRRRKEVIDQVAAQCILDDFLGAHA